MVAKPPAHSGPPTTRPSLPPASRTAGPAKKTHAAKSFSIQPWTGEGEGEKIVLYGRSGIGKTTLASMIPGAVFLGVDDGGRKIANPLTGKPIDVVKGIEDFQDVRDALAQDALWPDACTLVVDTLTKLDSEWIPAYVLENTKLNGNRVTSFRKFGWDGDRYSLDQMRLLLSDLDAHARRGHNVVLLCQQGQIRVANAEGADYLEDGPLLQHRNDCSAREEVKQWADHVLRIGFTELAVEKEAGAKAGKVTSQDTTRAVFSAGAQHFTAKSRPINRIHIPAVISFESETDNSLWRFVFEGATVGEGGAE